MKKIAAFALLCLITLCAWASPETDQVLANLKKKYPNTTFNSVEPAALPGLYEFTMGKNIAYTDKEGRYFMFGSLYDMDTRQDLTAPKREALSKIDVSKFPLQDAIVRVKGKGTRKLYLFTDPDCPYCKQLENATLPKLDDVTIYTFMFPIDQLHPQARAKAEAFWCLPENVRAEAWDKFMTTGALPPMNAKCENPVAKTIALGDSIGVRGTPAMFSEDGRSLPGAVPLDKLEAFLNGQKFN
ncbi:MULTISPECIES: DsbC family protein [Herbaspirillum]|uniref:Thiol:disulfide interchange protein n=2 Tax=Herbaspirillum huttiense TaxID=863372 RepID=A0AAJ2HAT5_9BURK|nr:MULTISPECIES: DsbC family protein [Herbaspirillum]MDR9837066.1 DsbC family protein [Herbaspirillum huttiense]